MILLSVEKTFKLDKPFRILKFELEKFTLDFLPKLKGSGKFKTAYENKEITTINGIDLLFIGFDELLKDKAANSRPKDLEDIKQLKSIKKK